jgi:hypothetical protein
VAAVVAVPQMLAVAVEAQVALDMRRLMPLPLVLCLQLPLAVGERVALLEHQQMVLMVAILFLVVLPLMEAVAAENMLHRV